MSHHRAEPDHDERRAVQTVRATATASVWVLGLAVILVALATCGLWALYLSRGRWADGDPTPTPVIWTPTPAPAPTATLSPSPTEGAPPTPTLSPGIAIGGYVRVTGTGGTGLNLRSGPGQDYDRIDVAQEGEVLVVVDGPTTVGGSEWWKLRDLQDEAREWWAIGNFLEPVEQP